MDGSEQSSPESARPCWQPFLRWVAVGGLVLGVGLLATGVALWTFVDADYLERQLNGALDRATAGQYQGEIGRVEWGFWTRSLRLHDVTMSPTGPSVGRTCTAKTLSRPRGRVSVSTVLLEGIHLGSLLWDRHLMLNAARLRRPRVRVQTSGRAEEVLSHVSSSALGETDPPSFGPLQGLTVHQFGVDGGQLVVERGEGLPQDSLWDVSLRLDGVSSEVLSRRPPLRVLASRFSEGTMEGYRRTFPDELYRLQVGPSRVSRPDSALTVESLRLTPTVPDSVFVRQHRYRTNRVRTAARRLTVDGFRMGQFLETGGFLADRMRIDSLHLDVYRDNHQPPQPKDPPPAMPHEMARSVERLFRVDTLRIQNSEIRYAKRAEDARLDGAISFENLWASLYNLTNDPQRMTSATPAEAAIRADVNGAGRLQATLRVPLLARRLSLSFEGRLGPLDATALNETFVYLGGVHIETGQVDSLWFEAEVEQGTATGSLQSTYRNLEVETLDKATGARGLKQRAKTVVVDGLALRSSNHPSDDPFHVGQIQHSHEEENTFFKFLWLSLRSGIYSMVGIDRLPR